MLTPLACDLEHHIGHFLSSAPQYLKAEGEEVNTENSNIKTHMKKDYTTVTGLRKPTKIRYQFQYRNSPIL